MAATYTTVNPTDTVFMAARRAPLATVPNAVNSPFRGMQQGSNNTGKRTRAQQVGENVYGQPPAKKQLLADHIKSEDEENLDPNVPTTARKIVLSRELDEPFSNKRPSTRPPTLFEKKLVEARDRKPASQAQSQRVSKSQSRGDDNLENVRLWQRHYRQQFPRFVFYFDNVPDETRVKAIRQVQSLGAVSRFRASPYPLYLTNNLTARREVLLKGSHSRGDNPIYPHWVH